MFENQKGTKVMKVRRGAMMPVQNSERELKATKVGRGSPRSLVPGADADADADADAEHDQYSTRGTNISFRNDLQAIHTAAAFGVALLGAVPVMQVFLVAFLPFWLAVFFITVPLILCSEVLGSLTIAIIQSFDPFYEKQMKAGII